MRAPTAPGSYDDYAQQRIIAKLNALRRSHGLSLGGIAAAISKERNIEFHREYMTRLRSGKLSAPLIAVVVDWIIAHHDPKFLEKLTPDAIFSEIGASARDFYFHLSKMENYDTWEESVLKAFEGVYIAAPENDLNSYLTMPQAREYFEIMEAGRGFYDHPPIPRSYDTKQFIRQHSILILRATAAGYYHAAEFAYSLLFPPQFQTLDAKMVHEGIGIASGNSIRIFLRDCLTRVGRSHSILIQPHGRNQDPHLRGVRLHAGEAVRTAAHAFWSTWDIEDIVRLKREHIAELKMGYYLVGNSQTEISPLSTARNTVNRTYTLDTIYRRKPKDFLRKPELHLLRPDVIRIEEIEKIIENPLAVRVLV